MDIIQWRSPLFGYPDGAHGRRGKVAQSICYHTMAGYWGTYQSYLKTKNSANYSVNLDGSIHAHVPEADSAWCNGVDWTLGYDRYQSVMTIPWMKEAWAQKVSPNCYTISIECEGKGDENPMPEVQYQALLWLSKDIRSRHPAINAVWGQGLIGHYMIDHQKVRCPGRFFPREKLVAALQPPPVIVVPPVVPSADALDAYVAAHPELGTVFSRGDAGFEILGATKTEYQRVSVIVRRGFTSEISAMTFEKLRP